ncbi:hypothetical protein BTO20_19710 [Mycobacterium dioxanotrophicus]|uniref:LppX_LprAFG lipoprotein n=1 Tax=Mycobacterium dioxanotrophicus TaxID=482462 RepID=A0A1Y0C621_9MYCO|nr:LppX_LprAFG lipoprotein [Mycobacterium dioxanotrophicus]ART70496.1 hypothetical protein BTO20_19710 [Mycobacterium dioxanotrophicus]
MPTPTVSAVATALAAVLLAGGCSTAAPPPAGSPPAAETAAAAPDLPSDPSAAVADAAVRLRATTAAAIMVATTGIENLIASSYAAQVSTDPAAANGNANLMINGERQQANFQVRDGELFLDSADGEPIAVGPARGNFDPTLLLDPQLGLASMIETISPVSFESPQPVNGGQVAGTVKLRGELPVAAAEAVLPRDSLRNLVSLPVTLWLDPDAGNALVQLIITAGGGALTLQIRDTH